MHRRDVHSKGFLEVLHRLSVILFGVSVFTLLHGVELHLLGVAAAEFQKRKLVPFYRYAELHTVDFDIGKERNDNLF